MNPKHFVGASLLAGALAVTVPQLALAQGNNYTPACTQINNQATVNFTVGSVAQNPQNSNTSSFYVGVKVNVSVVAQDTADVTVYPGSTGSPLTFTVTNNGNAHQKYLLSYLAKPNGTLNPFTGAADSFDASNPAIQVGGVATTTIADLAPDASQTVTINADTGLSQTDGQVAVYALKAQTQWVGSNTSVTADGTATGSTIGGAVCTPLGSANIDVVVADGQGSDDSPRDGASSARSAYQVTAANLTINKTNSVIYDPVHCTAIGSCTGTPKAIPGAIVEYSIAVANSASGTATVTVKDSLDANLTFYVDGYASGKGIQLTAPNLNGGAAIALSNGADGDQGDWNVTNAGAVTVTGIPVASGQTAYVKFRSSIN